MTIFGVWFEGPFCYFGIKPSTPTLHPFWVRQFFYNNFGLQNSHYVHVPYYIPRMFGHNISWPKYLPVYFKA